MENSSSNQIRNSLGYCMTHTVKQDVVCARTHCGYASKLCFSGGFGHHLPGPSSVQAGSDHLHSVVPLKCPGRLGTHHSYSDAHSLIGRNSTQTAYKVEDNNQRFEAINID